MEYMKAGTIKLICTYSSALNQLQLLYESNLAFLDIKKKPGIKTY